MNKEINKHLNIAMEVMKWQRFLIKSVLYVLKKLVIMLFDYVGINVYVQVVIKIKVI